MDNNDLLNQVLAAMNDQTETLVKMVKEEIHNAETRINTKIESEVTQRLDALTDGYKLNHEKQWELERELIDLKRRVERLENVG
ncbi:hypothetical protein [Anaerotruncus rubiinfantis]|uniref:hypothetical protein n=1 Tax=Anaerotruncus rubiinfantis TaxID=1720200 RepID=UPI0034A3E73D